MLRKARIEAPGALHHVMARGIERRIIFTGNEDCDDLLERLESIAAETHTSCYARESGPKPFSSAAEDRLCSDRNGYAPVVDRVRDSV